MAKNENSKNFPISFTQVALFGGAAYFLWKNRYKVQELLESQGVKTPWSAENIADAARSGGAKIRGATKFELNRDSV